MFAKVLVNFEKCFDMTKIKTVVSACFAVCIACYPCIAVSAPGNGSRTDALRRKLASPDRDYVFVAMHRGDWRNFPENSEGAVLSAIRLGADIVELDVQRTKDGRFVLNHDATLDRTTTGKGRVEDRTLAEIRKLRLRDGKGRPSEYGVLTLEEALALTRGKILMNIDKFTRHPREILDAVAAVGALREVLVKATLPYARAKKLFGPYWEKVERGELIYMPVVNVSRSDRSYKDGNLPAYLAAEPRKLSMYEMCFNDPKHVSETVAAIKAAPGSPRLWVNTLWDSISARHSDRAALLDPDGNWGWWLDRGATMIQSDYVAELIVYLTAKGRRDFGATVSVSSCGDVPSPRNVPELMKTFDGKAVSAPDAWEKTRAPEILDRYRREVFGVRPAAADARDRVSFKTTDTREAMEGTAIRKLVTAEFAGPEGVFTFPFTVFIPKAAKPVPAFVFICNRPRSNVDPDRAIKSGFWPAEEIVARGYATAAFLFSDVAADDKKAGYGQGVFPAFGKPSARDAESWASISAWAWAASRVMDWIETEPSIDAEHVGVVGHSRGGKTAIWAGVNDRRFAMVCSNNSGCSGAKLNHIDLPRSESIERITYNFPHWFCGNYRAYAGRDRDMPFDQHQLLALVAPRLLCVASASEDHWAGQPGEWWAAKLASPAWELYGKKGLVGDSHPGSGVPQQKGCVSYHQRAGKHDLTPADWARYMDFADAHGWRCTAGR